jgi:hypothetical protein
MKVRIRTRTSKTGLNRFGKVELSILSKNCGEAGFGWFFRNPLIIGITGSKIAIILNG